MTGVAVVALVGGVGQLLLAVHLAREAVAAGRRGGIVVAYGIIAGVGASAALLAGAVLAGWPCAG